MQELEKSLTIREFARTGILTEHATRMLVKQGKLPHIKVGNRVMIDYDSAITFLRESARNEVERA